MRIVGISGSLRKGSLNTQLLKFAGTLLPDGASLEIASSRDIPLYDGDVENAAFPPAVTKLKEQVAAADALLLASPEYNHSMPGVLKNVIDWLSRPPADIDRVFRGKPVAIIGASPGSFGTARGQAAWLPVLRAVQLRPFFELPPFYLAKANQAFDANGQLTDPKSKELLTGFLHGFAAFAAR